MSYNTFGHIFRVTTWGESHGPAIGATVDGCLFVGNDSDGSSGGAIYSSRSGPVTVTTHMSGLIEAPWSTVPTAGAADVLVIRDGQAERMIPLVDDWVAEVDIEGREIVTADPNPLKKKRPWKVWVSNAWTDGDVRLWIYNVQGSLSGSAAVDLTAQSRGGAFSLDATGIDLQLDLAFINSDTELFSGGSLQGALGFSPFAPRDKHRWTGRRCT